MLTVSLRIYKLPMTNKAADKALALLKSSPDSALSDLHNGEHINKTFAKPLPTIHRLWAYRISCSNSGIGDWHSCKVSYLTGTYRVWMQYKES